MSVNPRGGPAYIGPVYDDPEPRPLPQDPGFSKPATLPGEEEAGPLYLSPEAERWVEQNITAPGYVIDWGTREIIDPETGEVKGTVPTTFDRMI